MTAYHRWVREKGPGDEEDREFKVKRVVHIVIVNDDSGTEDDPDGDYSRC